MAGGTCSKESNLMVRTIFDGRLTDQRKSRIDVIQGLAMTVLRHRRPCGNTPLWYCKVNQIRACQVQCKQFRPRPCPILELIGKRMSDRRVNLLSPAN